MEAFFGSLGSRRDCVAHSPIFFMSYSPDAPMYETASRRPRPLTRDRLMLWGQLRILRLKICPKLTLKSALSARPAVRDTSLLLYRILAKTERRDTSSRRATSGLRGGDTVRRRAPWRRSLWSLRAAPVPGAQLRGRDGAGGRQLRHQDGVAGPAPDPGGLLSDAPLHGRQVGRLGGLRLRGAVLNGAF
ncbi:hypothetical protein EYF80_046933 [Liparis tanakae]|uniref:Uncharacterized protein n=1 Tax=Liparis tanakae TaxID=230148 RepID=A0A4Z2FR57_9TELE|nr:hypothetical protein EYF80_046933 [Liparis tanakae]